MRPLADWLTDAMSLSTPDFRVRNPEPFLVWCTAHGPDAARYDGMRTLVRANIQRPSDGHILGDPSMRLSSYYAQRLNATAERPALCIGCGSDCDVQVNDASVSRHHAEIAKRADGFTLRDTSSQFGTLVNGKPISGETKLTPGDRITLGNIELLFYDAARVYSLLHMVDPDV